MKSDSKRIKGIKTEWLREIAFYKLFILNLHNAVKHCVKLENIFKDMYKKRDEDYVYGRVYITDIVTLMLESLYSLGLYINSLTEGEDIELFYNLDKLKTRLSKCIESTTPRKESLSADMTYNRTFDDTSVLLNEILEDTARVTITYGGLSAMNHLDQGTAHDMLIFSYNRVFSILDGWFRAIEKVGEKSLSRETGLVGIPISYLRQNGEPEIDRSISVEKLDGDYYSNPGTARFFEGIYEVYNSDIYAPYLSAARDNDDLRGMLVYSNETFAMYQTSSQYRNLITANVCDAVGGNYINMLIGSASRGDVIGLSDKFVDRLLDWLDFDSFSGYGFTIATIDNMTREDTENHLNMLGKFLAFITSKRIPLRNEEDVRNSVEIFLENIV